MTQYISYDSLNCLTKGTTSNDSAKGCTTQLGNGNYDEDYTYDSATGNLLTKTGLGNYTYNSSHPHAVVSTSANNWSFTYDSNCNMTQHNVGSTYNYSYNAENKLTEVSGGTTASFTYDGDGNRVKTVVGGTTTAFLGSYYEWTSSTVKKYYFAGNTRIAMRENSTLIFLAGDHLGSTSLVYKTDTGLVIKKLYKPWGETRYTSTTMPTKFQFTGQYRETNLGGADGLYYYVARWYDQALGRFMQADTIILKPTQDIQSWDRFAYSNNNPINRIDSTGHWSITFGYNLSTFVNSIINVNPFGISNTEIATALDAVAIYMDTAALAIDSTIAVGDIVTATIGATAGAGIAAPEGGVPIVVTGTQGGLVGLVLFESNPAVRAGLTVGNIISTVSTIPTTLSDVITGETNDALSLTLSDSGIQLNILKILGRDTYTSFVSSTAGWLSPIGVTSAPLTLITWLNDRKKLYVGTLEQIPQNILYLKVDIHLPW